MTLKRGLVNIGVVTHCALSIAVCITSSAQAAPQVVEQPSDGKGAWRIEARVGPAISTASDLGRGELPSASRVTVVPLGLPISTRIVPSWFFGSGPLLLREVALAAALRAQPGVMDDAIAAGAARPRYSPSVSIALTRKVRSETEILFEVATSNSAPMFTNAAVTAMRAGAVDFASFWKEVQKSIGDEPSAAATLRREGSSIELQATAGIRAHLMRLGAFAWTWHASGGVRGGLRPPQLVISGSYEFSVEHPITGLPMIFREYDNVVLRLHRRRISPVVSFGTALDWLHRRRRGVTASAAVTVATSRDSVTLSATPERVWSADPSRAGVFAVRGGGATGSAAPPGLIFNNSIPLSRSFPSSLSAPPVENFEVLSDAAVQVRFILQVGYFVRF